VKQRGRGVAREKKRGERERNKKGEDEGWGPEKDETCQKLNCPYERAKCTRAVLKTKVPKVRGK